MTLSDILLLYTFIILAVAGAAYALFKIREKNLHWELSRPRLARCTLCNRVFLMKRQAPVARCPRCNGVSTTYI